MTEIAWLDLSWCVIPLIIIGGIYRQWQGNLRELAVAVLRMLLQLVAVGYVLLSIFAQPSPWLSALIVIIMLMVAAWIAIRPVRDQSAYLLAATFSLAVAVVLHLFLSVVCILQAASWYQPDLLIPLAGMYLANTMNAISLSAERYAAERANLTSPHQAKIIAFHAAMIPQINGLLAVGLVALPGMMTGQILSGVSPLIAVRYQIMIMIMLLGASGMGAAMMLQILAGRESKFEDQRR